MLTVMLLGLALGAQPADCDVKADSLPTTLVVQAVDELWLPLPGALIIVREGKHSPEVARGTTDASGFVHLSITKRGAYEVEVSLVGFKGRRVGKIDVDADPSKLIPYVQVKLKVAVPKEVITDMLRRKGWVARSGYAGVGAVEQADAADEAQGGTRMAS